MNFSVGGDNNGEKWILQKWGKYSTKHQKDIVIFDVGANIGQYASMIHAHIPQKHIFSFEPSTHTFEQLRHNTAHIAHMQYYNF